MDNRTTTHPLSGGTWPELTYEALDLAADPGLRMIAYSAETQQRICGRAELLASWAATLDQLDRTEAAQATDAA